MGNDGRRQLQATNQPTKSRSSRFLLEILFSLNIALVAKLLGNQRPNWFFSRLEYGEASLGPRVNASLHLHPHSNIGANAAFIMYGMAWAACFFLLLEIFSGTPLAQRFRSSMAGVVSLLALPVYWLYVSRLLGSDSTLPRPPWVLLFLELVAATVCAVMYLRTKWSLPAWGGVILLGLHFAVWDAVCFGPYFWRAPFQSIFAVAGFCSVVAWGYYVSAQRQAYSVTTLTPST